MRTIDKIITDLDCKYGAPMGRVNVYPKTIEVVNGQEMIYTGKLFDCKVKLDSGGYDKGGAYWGIGKDLRVKYNKSLTYIEFYRTK